MADNRAALINLMNQVIISGGRQTTAVNTRSLITDLVNSLPNISDDKDLPNGYVGVNSSGIANTTTLKASSTNGYFLRDDGTWQPAAVSGGYTKGSIMFAGGAGTITQDNAKFFWDDTNVLFYVGGNTGAFPQTKLQVYDSFNGFSQSNHTNTSNGTSASTDGVWTADTGTNTANFVNVGINSSTYSVGSYTISGPLDSYLVSNGGNLVIGTETSNNINFFTGGTMLANLAGQFVNGTGFLVGGRTAFGAGAAFGSTVNNYFTGAITGGTTAYGIYTDSVVQSGVTASAKYFTTSASTFASAFALTELVHYEANQGTIGAGSSATAQAGFKASASIAGATNNYGFQGILGASANNYNIYMNGAAQNYMNGSLGIGALTPATKLQVLSTTEQLRLNYDNSNYLSTTVSSTGGVTVSPTGTGTSYTVNNLIITKPASTATLTLVTGSSLITAGAFALTLTTASATNATFPAGTGTLAYITGVNNWAPSARGSGAVPAFTFTGPADTAQTLSTATPKFLFTLASTQFATGALATTQPFVSFTQPTISFVGASTASQVSSVRIAGAPIQGANATNTVSIGLHIDNAAVITGAGTSYGLLANAQTGGTINYAAGFAGNVILTTAGNKFLITEGTNGSVGQVALVAGTKAISIAGVTTSTRAFITLVTPSGTSSTTTYQAVCTSGTVTIQANVAAGTINVSDVSTLNYFIIN